MKKQDIVQFMSSILPDLTISIKYYSNKEYSKYFGVGGACIVLIAKESIVLVAINKSEFNWSCPNHWMKAVILHEAGHVKYYNTNGWFSEFVAHRWAINKAHKMKLPKVANALNKITKQWKNIRWNQEQGKLRKYILASKHL